MHSNHSRIKDASTGTYYKRTSSVTMKVDMATKIDRDIRHAEHPTSSKSIVAIESAAALFNNEQDYTEINH